MATSALLGYTGYVGSNLATQGEYTHLYNSSNINSINGHTFDTITCAAAPGFKLGATQLNQTMEGLAYNDAAALDGLKDVLSQVKCRGTFILISTLSVYAVTSDAESKKLQPTVRFSRSQPEHTLNEDRDVWSRSLATGGMSDHEYGRNRAKLEHWLMTESPFKENYLIVRLPGIFGPGMKKNYLFDLITNSEWLFKVNLNTRHQWYPLRHLSEDINTVLAANKKPHATTITIVNLFPQDISTGEIVQRFFPQHLHKCRKNAAFTFVDAVRSKVVALWGRARREDDEEDSTLFRFSRAETMEQLDGFFGNRRVMVAIREKAVRDKQHLKANM